MNRQRMQQPKGSLFLRNVPLGLREQFKAYCARRGTNMTAEVVRLMKAAIKKDDQVQLKKDKL